MHVDVVGLKRKLMPNSKSAIGPPLVVKDTAEIVTNIEKVRPLVSYPRIRRPNSLLIPRRSLAIGVQQKIKL
jgi:hypothetical protein